MTATYSSPHVFAHGVVPADSGDRLTVGILALHEDCEPGTHTLYALEGGDRLQVEIPQLPPFSYGQTLWLFNAKLPD